jgi:hypothetical protein
MSQPFPFTILLLYFSLDAISYLSLTHIVPSPLTARHLKPLLSAWAFGNK